MISRKIAHVFIFLFIPTLSFAADPNALKVGVLQSLTGIAAEDGKTVVQALELAAEDLRKKGMSIELIVQDDQTVPRNSVSAFQSMLTFRPDAIIGASWDFTTNPIIPLAAKHQMVLFNTTGYPECLTLDDSKGFAFTNSTPVSEEAEPFRRFLLREKPKRVVLVFANNSWGEAQRNAYYKVATEEGITFLDEIRPSNFEDNEWRQVLPRIKTKNPDLVVLLVNRNDLVTILRRAGEGNLKTKFFTSKHTYEALSVSSTKELFEDICFAYPLERHNLQTDFVRRYKLKFGEEPRINADTSYDALSILAQAKATAIKKSLSLAAALREGVYTGIVGTYKFNSVKSFGLGDSSLVCVENGKAKIIKKTGY